MTILSIPFFKELYPNLQIFYIPFVIFVITATSNAVNLTDGLDGLAIGPSIVAAFSFAGLAYVSGNVVMADYLNIAYVRGAGELTIFCGSSWGPGSDSSGSTLFRLKCLWGISALSRSAEP